MQSIGMLEYSLNEYYESKVRRLLSFSGVFYNQMSKQQLQGRLIEQEERERSKETPLPVLNSVSLSEDYDYRVEGYEPKVKLSNLSLIIIGPILTVIHPLVAYFFEIPILQYLFVTTLTAFLINYLGIIRRYELYPYLPQVPLDNRLKVLCLVCFAGIILSIYIGWNGSGGLLFAMFWEITRGQRMSIYGLYFLGIIVGSLLMEENYSWSKLWEFLPGILLGWVNSQIFKLKSSNYYTIAHEMLFLCSIAIPIFFPATTMIVPTLWQWLLMVVCGAVMLVTIVLVIRMMQLVRVSVVVGVSAGILMAGTAPYASGRQYVGVSIIAIAIILLLRAQFADSV